MYKQLLHLQVRITAYRNIWRDARGYIGFGHFFEQIGATSDLEGMERKSSKSSRRHKANEVETIV